MKRGVLWILILLSAVTLLIRFSGQIEQILFGNFQKGGISVMSVPDGASVFLDGQKVGETPFEDKKLEVREYIVKLQKDDARWQSKIKLIPGTVTTINRDLASDLASSAGETLTLKRGQGITVVSNPSAAVVEIDGVFIGNTPLNKNISEGEHLILVSHPGFLNRSMQVNLPPNFNLTVSVDLVLSEADLTRIENSPPDPNQIIVTQTPTGFLRVRNQPSLNGREIAQVKVGDRLILLESLTGWDKIRLPDGSEGFVSSDYTQKLP